MRSDLADRLSAIDELLCDQSGTLRVGQHLVLDNGCESWILVLVLNDDRVIVRYFFQGVELTG